MRYPLCGRGQAALLLGALRGDGGEEQKEEEPTMKLSDVPKYIGAVLESLDEVVDWLSAIHGQVRFHPGQVDVSVMVGDDVVHSSRDVPAGGPHLALFYAGQGLVTELRNYHARKTNPAAPGARFGPPPETPRTYA
jgi:hypothetical protein